jgi:thioredoxin-dependent peroxiredoxin
MKKCLLAVFAAVAAVPFDRGRLVGDDSPPAATQEALTVGQPLPALESIDDAGHPWKLADYGRHRVLVIYFYPGDFTSGCIKQAQSFREGLKRLEDLNVDVVGVSGDEVATHQLFKVSHSLRHTLLADPEGALAAQLDIPIRRQNAPAKVRAIDLDRQPLIDEQGQSILVERKVTFPRWTLIVDRDGKLVSKRTKVNPATDADEVQKIVESLFMDVRGGSQAGDLSK